MNYDHFNRFFPLIKGSIGETHFKCGKKNCICSQGKLHSAHYLSYRRDGKTHTVHIPKPLIPEITKHCNNWRKFNKQIEKQGHNKIQSILQKYKNKKL